MIERLYERCAKLLETFEAGFYSKNDLASFDREIELAKRDLPLERKIIYTRDKK
jgi:hypothetical protein